MSRLKILLVEDDAETAGFIRRGLTEAGHALRKEARAVPEGAFCATGCQPEQLQALRRELEQLRASLADQM